MSNVKMLSQQEIFDKGLAHIRQQGEPSLEGQSCRYLAVSGNSCVVGGLILPELRSAEFDDSSNTSVRSLIRDLKFNEALRQSGIDTGRPGVIDLLDAMQLCHDGASDRLDFISTFERYMKQNAGMVGLTYTPAVTQTQLS